MLGVLISAQVERERQRFRVAPQRWGAGKGSTLDRSLDQLAAASAPRRTIPARESADNTTNPNRAVNFSVSDTG